MEVSNKKTPHKIKDKHRFRYFQHFGRKPTEQKKKIEKYNSTHEFSFGLQLKIEMYKLYMLVFTYTNTATHTHI